MTVQIMVLDPVTKQTREHWIQHITFAAKTKAADTHTVWQRYAERHNTLSARWAAVKVTNQSVLLVYNLLQE